jgi:hypothetical protein
MAPKRHQYRVFAPVRDLLEDGEQKRMADDPEDDHPAHDRHGVKGYLQIGQGTLHMCWFSTGAARLCRLDFLQRKLAQQRVCLYNVRFVVRQQYKTAIIYKIKKRITDWIARIQNVFLYVEIAAKPKEIWVTRSANKTMGPVEWLLLRMLSMFW